MKSAGMRSAVKKALSAATLAAFLGTKSFSLAALPSGVDTSKLPSDGGADYNRLIFDFFLS